MSILLQQRPACTVLSIINNSVLLTAGWRPGGTCRWTETHEKFIKERNIWKEWIAADSSLEMTSNFTWSAMNRVKLRSKAENGSSESAETLASNRYGRLPAWITLFNGKANQINSKERYGSPPKLEDEEQFPLHHSPLWRRLGSQLAFGAVVSGLSGLINPKRASIPGGTWRGRVFSTWATRGGVNYATRWREEARLALVWFADIIGSLAEVGGQTHKSGTPTRWGENTGGLEGPLRAAHAVKYWSNKYLK